MIQGRHIRSQPVGNSEKAVRTGLVGTIAAATLLSPVSAMASETPKPQDSDVALNSAGTVSASAYTEIEKAAGVPEAQREVDEAGKALDETEQAYAQAQQDTKAARAALTDAQTKRDEAGKTADAAESAVKDAEQALKTAQDGLAAIDPDAARQRLKEAQEALAAAGLALDGANDGLKDAEAALDAAKTVLDEAVKADAEKSAVLKTAQAGYRKAVDAKNTADRALKAAKAKAAALEAARKQSLQQTQQGSNPVSAKTNGGKVTALASTGAEGEMPLSVMAIMAVAGAGSLILRKRYAKHSAGWSESER